MENIVIIFNVKISTIGLNIFYVKGGKRYE